MTHPQAAPPAGLDADCPVRRVLRLVGDKWTPVILYALATGTSRYGALQQRIPDISKKMLTQVLRRLEHAGLVDRTAIAGPIPKTEYRLTEAGVRLHEAGALLCHWAERNQDLLDAIDRRAASGRPRA